MIPPLVNSSSSGEGFGNNQIGNQANMLGYVVSKKLFDLVLSVMLLPVFLTGCLILAAANPFLNRGPMFYVQKRMGRDCKPFMAIKFRSMVTPKHPSRYRGA